MTRYTLRGAAKRALAASDVRIVLTGASGWLGMATLEMLADALGERFAERVRCFGSRGTTLRLRDGSAVEQAPLDRIGALPPAPGIVLHHAFLTKDRVGAMDDAAYAAANAVIAATVLGALDAIGTLGVFLPSSGAAYAADDPAAAPALRLYGGLKAADERAFAEWAQASGRPLVTARVFNLTGPYLNKHEHYALAAFLLDARSGRPIRIGATRQVERSFVAIRDLMSLALCLLLAGESAAFDACGAEVLEMAQLAARVADALGSEAGIERPPLVSGAPDRYVGDPARFLALCERFGFAPTPFDAELRATAQGMA